ncbi:MAG: hypothetical protein M3Z13_08075 [Candidatus Dormibacteraeota bacterium]|nr:hypothetical protein [Candidatus Dormibacteraeota bacterium]
MIQRTVEEQNRALFWHRRKQLGAKPRQLMHETDELLFWLEECLVQEVKMVPGWLLPRISQLISQTDRELLEELGRDRRPDQVMEVLFRAQEVLMAETVRSRTQAKVIPLFKSR